MLAAQPSTASAYSDLTRRLQGAYASGTAYQARRSGASRERSGDGAPMRTGPATCPAGACNGRASETSTVLPFRPR